MSDIAIRIENLSKAYLISHKGNQRSRYKTLREDLVTALSWPVRRLTMRTEASSKELFFALKDVSFEIKHGDVVGLVGRNGAGKSTLLKILSQITDPTSGYAEVYGRVGSLLEVGTGFHPELTGRENIFLNGTILGMTRKEIQSKFDEIVDFAGIETFLDTPVKRYSSGMYVRLAFAVAAHLELEILVIDEVLAVGDAAFQKKCLGKMSEVSKTGRTILFVSHNMGAVKQLCNRGVLLSSGEVKLIGDMDTVIDAYLTNREEASPTVDLSGYRDNYGNGEITVSSVELLNAVGNTFATAWDEPIRLKVNFRANQKLSNVSFGIGCQTSDGMPVFTVRSMDQPGSEYFFGEADLNEPKEIEVEIAHNLRAGHYTLVLGIASGSSNYYYHPSFATLEILDTGKNEYRYRNNGLINCDAIWSL